MESRNLDDLDAGWEGNNTKSLMGMSSVLQKNLVINQSIQQTILSEPRWTPVSSRCPQVWAAARFDPQERRRTSAWTGAAVTAAWRRSAAPQGGGRTRRRRHDSADAPRSAAGWGCSSRWVAGEHWRQLRQEEEVHYWSISSQDSLIQCTNYFIITQTHNPSQRTVSDLRLKQKPHYQDGFKSRFNFHCELKYVCRERLCSTKWSLV